MKFGICGGAEIAAVAAAAGYDYIEMSVAGVLKPRESDAAFQAALPAVTHAALPCRALNMFVPADLKITGASVDLPALSAYVTTACQRARLAEIPLIVFGSGGARRIPDGYDRAAAHAQLVAFCRMLGPIAQANRVTIAVEPLCRAECNVLTSVGECAALVREVRQPAIRLLVDAYHWMKDDDAAADIVANGALLAHAHLATKANRTAPGAEECDLAPFFNALKRSGYDGTLSIEGRIADPAADLPRALELMQRLWRAAA